MNSRLQPVAGHNLPSLNATGATRPSAPLKRIARVNKPLTAREHVQRHQAPRLSHEVPLLTDRGPRQSATAGGTVRRGLPTHRPVQLQPAPTGGVSLRKPPTLEAAPLQPVPPSAAAPAAAPSHRSAALLEGGGSTSQRGGAPNDGGGGHQHQHHGASAAVGHLTDRGGHGGGGSACQNGGAAGGSVDKRSRRSSRDMGAAGRTASAGRAASDGIGAPGPGALYGARQEEYSTTAGSSLPMSASDTMELHGSTLTDYERAEIHDYSEIWCTGHTAEKVRSTLLPGEDNHGFDDDRGDYTVSMYDHLQYRYQIMGILGKGSFGQVVKAFDYLTQQMVAIKVIRNKSRFHKQALVEVKVLTHLRDNDPHDETNTVQMLGSFTFRNHLCIVFELLSLNLYDFIKNNNFMGISLPLIRRFAVQLLNTLRYLQKHHIVHCDLKPENILLRSPGKSAIKVIDFGSSCFEEQPVYTYIQSRFYRCPEVILGLPYYCKIDMWSFGCILAELYTGYPLFAGENEVEQLACIMEVLGLPPKNLINDCSRRKQFFDSQGVPRILPNSRGKKRRPASKDLITALRCTDVAFVSFLEGCLRWDANERFSPDEALRHEWILELATPPPPSARPSAAERPRTRNGRQPSHPEPTGGALSDRSHLGPSTAHLAAALIPSIGHSSMLPSIDCNDVAALPRGFRAR